jgi:hypothetical protein
MGLLSQGGNPPVVDVRDKLITITFDQIDVRDALKQLFQSVDKPYIVEPTVQGKISVLLKDHPLEQTIKMVLDQVNATYTVENGVYVCVLKKTRPLDATTPYKRWVVLPDFKPGQYSTSYSVPNKPLFMSPHQTMGGTFDLLAESVKVAGYTSKTLFSYGKNGFAIVLPPELIGKDGHRVDSHRLPRDLGNRWLLEGKVADEWRAAGGRANSTYRIITLLVTADPILSDGLSSKANWNLSSINPTLPESVRSQKWTSAPTLTVLVYEYRNAGDSSKAEGSTFILLKTGESKISAVDHVVASGLWTAEQLK